MWERIAARHPRLFAVVKHAIFPAAFYFTAFCLLTYPLMGKFGRFFFGDPLDGLQNVWNIWWVNLVVRHPNQYASIWYTNLLHWPYGTTLIGHTLNPFNGYLGAVLLTFFSLRATYNTIVIFTFVMGGVTMYWLAYYLTKSYWASLIAGFLFTFSSYHFGHSSHQLQTASLEWIPLFLLCWLQLLRRPHALTGIAAALALWLVILCDYYYFTYCVIAAVVILAWYAISRKAWRFLLQAEYVIPLGLFAITELLLAGPQAGRLLLTNYRDPLAGAHDATAYSLDLLGLLIPGGLWLFGSWTEWYWSKLPGNAIESSVYLALPVFFLVVYAWIRRKSLAPEARAQLYLWSALAAIFFLLALGPALLVAGTPVWDRFMPYTLLGAVLPFFSLSGVPARMTVMVLLATSILSAFALRELTGQGRGRQLLVIVLLAVIVFEALPAPLATTRVDVPAYVNALAHLPDDGGVLNQVKARLGLQLYYETVYAKPVAFGYLARVPASVVAQDARLSDAIAAQDYATLLFTYRIRYIVTEDTVSVPPNQMGLTAEVLYDKGGVRIYRLGCTCEGK